MGDFRGCWIEDNNEVYVYKPIAYYFGMPVYNDDQLEIGTIKMVYKDTITLAKNVTDTNK